MNHYSCLRPGDVVAVYDHHTHRWTAATIKVVNRAKGLFTAWTSNHVTLGELPICSAFVRPVRLVYCRQCSEMRRAA
jgi:hypothetical protein